MKDKTARNCPKTDFWQLQVLSNNLYVILNICTYIPLKSIQCSSKKFYRCRKIFVTFPEFSKKWTCQNNSLIFCRIWSIDMHWILFQIQIWVRQTIHFYFLSLMTSDFSLFSIFETADGWARFNHLGFKMRILKSFLYIFWHFIEIFGIFSRYLEPALTRVFKKVV